MTVLDVGTGSAILAIAAAKLGAKSLLGIDTDNLAVTAATANAALNNVADSITIRQGTLDTVGQRGWDIVVVNILAPVIIALFGQDSLLDYVADDGYLILSGIIEEQGEAVVTAVMAAGGQIIETLQVRDWVAFIVARNR
jgi:ribosomal protein L11 methyltransferase